MCGSSLHQEIWRFTEKLFGIQKKLFILNFPQLITQTPINLCEVQVSSSSESSLIKKIILKKLIKKLESFFKFVIYTSLNLNVQILWQKKFFFLH